MLIVNLYGAPGPGKVMCLNYLDANLSEAGLNVKFITEFDKDTGWQENRADFRNPVASLGRQYSQLSQMDEDVDVVITNSPLFLSSYFNEDPDIQAELDALIAKLSAKYPTYNAFILQQNWHYSGRQLPTEEESDAIASSLESFLKARNIPFKQYPNTINGIDAVFEDVYAIIEQSEAKAD